MSGFLLDTNICSELSRPRPEPRVVHWLEAADDSELFLSVITIGELHKGFVLQKDSKRRQFLESWLRTELLPWCDGRILPVTVVIAERWGTLPVERDAPQHGGWPNSRNRAAEWAYGCDPQRETFCRSRCPDPQPLGT